MTVAIKISHTHYTIAGRKSGPVRGTDANVVVEIPYPRLLCTRIVENPIGLSVLVKVTCRHEFPTGRKRRAVRGTDANVVAEVPYSRLPCAGVEQKVIWMTVAIKISHTHYTIARRKSGSERGSDVNVVVEIPYLRQSCAPSVKDIVAPPIVVTVRRCRRGRIHQVVTYDIEIDAFGRCKSDVGGLAWTTNRILHIRVCLRAGSAQPIAVVAGRILIEINDPGAAAIDREIARAARSEISDASR